MFSCQLFFRGDLIELVIFLTWCFIAFSRAYILGISFSILHTQASTRQLATHLVVLPLIHRILHFIRDKKVICPRVALLIYPEFPRFEKVGICFPCRGKKQGLYINAIQLDWTSLAIVGEGGREAQRFYVYEFWLCGRKFGGKLQRKRLLYLL